jgi:hypothetical protein
MELLFEKLNGSAHFAAAPVGIIRDADAFIIRRNRTI